jgi:membrane associated rhomboid family serine protease
MFYYYVDPISLMYYQYMSGDGSNNNGRHLTYPDSNSTNQQINRTLEDNLQSEWWTGIQTSMNAVKKKHPKNVDFYIIDGEGHCSFGLYYPLQDEGFEEWAAPIVKEGRVVGNKRPSAAVFLCSVALGGLLALATLTAMKQKNQSKLLDGEASMNESSGARRMPAAILQIKSVILRQSSRYSSYPWTAAYIFATTLYFVCMLVVQGFAHPLDNPSLGPSAVGLSSFGINNPSLVIYKMEHYRLFTSTFLCSGVLTYLMVMFSMYKHGAALESALLENKHHHWTFPMVAAIISMGANLFYACIGKGASCTSLALAIGLNVFSGVLQRRSAAANLNSLYPSPWVFTIFWSVIGSTPLFPFDSVVAILVSVVIGAALGLLLFDSNKSEQIDTDNYADSSVSVQENESASIRWSFVKGTGAAYCILYLLIVFRVPSPDERNVHPYLTGCNLVYSDQIGEFVEKYANGYNGRMLQGNDDVFDGQNLCAQLCIPHLVHRPLIWGVRKLGLVAVEEGTCEENGYDEHIADKTVREYTITFEVQVFTQSQDE